MEFFLNDDIHIYFVTAVFRKLDTLIRKIRSGRIPLLITPEVILSVLSLNVPIQRHDQAISFIFANNCLSVSSLLCVNSNGDVVNGLKYIGTLSSL